MLKSLIGFLLIGLTVVGWSQEQRARRFRMELEPISVFRQGVSGSILYTIDKNQLWSLGFFGAAMDVSKRTAEKSFFEVNKDSAQVRLGLQAGISVRRKIKFFCFYESNPYVGFKLGWQYFDVVQEPIIDPVRLSAFVIIPNLGYEFYLWNRQLYINPQVQGVFYAGQDTDNPARPEAIGSVFILPQVFIGFKF
jgi:hypothetical protein